MAASAPREGGTGTRSERVPKKVEPERGQSGRTQWWIQGGGAIVP